ncbi:MAG TPA: hypothetical protein VFM33_01145, partial [Aquabacterium sp.]|nr:hypothetical protein [Aquabacterium sp.]
MNTHQDTSAERERFERAYSEQYTVTVLTTADLFERDAAGDYTRTPTQVGWRMWQAALASRDEAAQGDPAHRLRSEISRLRDLLAQVADEPNIDR